MHYLVIVDLGSNSARMVVEKINDDGTYTELVRRKQDTRISQGMGPNNILQQEPMDRTIKALKAFQDVYEEYTPRDVMCITTAAVRMAQNKAVFLQRCKQELGLNFQILTGLEEANYDYLGVLATLKDIQDAVILDTGGASVELIAVKNRKNIGHISVPFGAVSLAERFSLDKSVAISNLNDAKSYIQQYYEQISWLKEQKEVPVILLGGANRSLARMNKKIDDKHTLGEIHAYKMLYKDVADIFNAVSKMSYEQRKEIVGLEKDRADIIVSGMLPLVTLMEYISAQEVIFSESGVREGMIAEKIEEIIGIKVDDQLHEFIE